MAVFDEISQQFRPGDIVVVSRLFISRTEPKAVLEIRPWIYNAGLLADDLAGRGVHLVITGPPPIFPYNDIRECSLEERESCRLRRDEFADMVDEVTTLLDGLEASKSNVAIFDIFDSVCPATDNVLLPG